MNVDVKRIRPLIFMHEPEDGLGKPKTVSEHDIFFRTENVIYHLCN